MASFTTAAAVVSACGQLGLHGRVFLITGCSNGIGFACATALVRGGATLVMACRAGAKAATARDELEKYAKEVGSDAKIYLLDLDLGSQDSVRQCASEFLALEGGSLPLHSLINNAGINGVPTWGVQTPGIETQFAVNFIGHFLLTELLHERLASTPGSRVVNLSSESHRRVSVWSAVPPAKETYDPLHAYAFSNLCRILWTRAKADQVKRDAVTPSAAYPVVCLHPGVVGGTGMLQHMTIGQVLRQVYLVVKWELRGFLKGQTVEQVAATQTWAAVAPVEQVDAVSGAYLNGDTNQKQNLPSTCTWDDIKHLGVPDTPTKLAQSNELAEELVAFAKRHTQL